MTNIVSILSFGVPYFWYRLLFLHSVKERNGAREEKERGGWREVMQQERWGLLMEKIIQTEKNPALQRIHHIAEHKDAWHLGERPPSPLTPFILPPFHPCLLTALPPLSSCVVVYFCMLAFCYHPHHAAEYPTGAARDVKHINQDFIKICPNNGELSSLSYTIHLPLIKSHYQIESQWIHWMVDGYTFSEKIKHNWEETFLTYSICYSFSMVLYIYCICCFFIQ